MPNIKEFIITFKVKALINTNPNFPENTHAVEIVGEMIQDAKSQCLRLVGRTNDKGLQKYLNGKITTYESIEKTLK